MIAFKKYFTIALLSFILLQPVLVYAQTNTASGIPQYSGVDSSISNYLCTPSDPPNGKDVEMCVNKLYRFGISFGAIALVFFLVYAGYMYMIGGETGKNSAKKTLENALVGMSFLLGVYVLLGFINPNLLLFKTIQPPIFTSSGLPSCEDVGLGAACVLPDGQIGTGGLATGTIGTYVLAGYDVGSYATAAEFRTNVTAIYKSMEKVDLSTAAKITAFMKTKASSTPLTGEMVQSTSRKYNVEVKMLLTMMQNDSVYGTAGKGARSHNPGNVGNDDSGRIVDYGTWEKGVDAVGDWLNRHRAK